MPIPRTIWMLWFQGEDQAPPLIRSCIRSWRMLNPGWDLRLLTESDIAEHREAAGGQVTMQALSDVIRVNLLARHGGVWVDATCLCMRPLDDWVDDYARSGFFAFAKPGRDRLISSWFMASADSCPLMADYADTVNRYVRANDFQEPKNLCARWFSRNMRRLAGHNPWTAALLASPTYAKYVGDTPYYWFHYTFARLLVASKSARMIWSTTPRISADGPHFLQYRGMYAPTSEEVARRVDSGQDRVYKLNRRTTPPENRSRESNVDYAMRKIGIEPEY